MSIDSGMLVAKLVAELGGVKGRKRLQKMVYLLQASKTKYFGYRFILHYYGPYCAELADDLDFLSNVEILKEEPPQGGLGSYAYTMPDEDVKSEIDQMFKDEPSDPDWVEHARTLKERDLDLLEAQSTVVFLMTQRDLKDQALRERFESIKPKLTGLFDDALDLAESEGYLSEPNGA